MITRFAWETVEAGVTSELRYFCQKRTTVSIGTGEQDREWDAGVAIHKAYTKYADDCHLRDTGYPFTN